MIGFIVNPASGSGRGAKIWKIIEDELRAKDIPFRVRFTAGPGDAVRMAKEMAMDAKIAAVVAVSGDGTVNEAIQGLRETALTNPTVFGHIPAGSGNDFARGHGIPADPGEALELVLRLSAQGRDGAEKIDLLELKSRIAANSAGCGFDGEVCLATNSSRYKAWLNRFHLGRIAYIISVVRLLLTYRPSSMTVRIDGRESRLDRTWLVAICNTPYFGGGMKICPDALPSDGNAAVCAVSGISRWELLRVFPLVFSGKHTSHPAVHMFSGSSIEIIPDRPLAAQADGEPVSDNPFTVRVLPGALAVLKPKTAEAGRGASEQAAANQ